MGKSIIGKQSQALAASRKRHNQGQALIEVAIVMTLLIILTLGLIQFGFIYNAVGTLTHLTREGARYAAIHATDNTTVFNGTTTTPDAATRAYIREKARGTSIRPVDLTDADITITPAQGSSQRSSGRSITVSIRYNMRRKLFLPTTFLSLARITTSYRPSITHVIE